MTTETRRWVDELGHFNAETVIKKVVDGVEFMRIARSIGFKSSPNHGLDVDMAMKALRRDIKNYKDGVGQDLDVEPNRL